MPAPTRLINATAPIRICDLGGWTDTWFAETGVVCNLGVYPYAEVNLKVTSRAGRPLIAVEVEDYGDRYTLDPRAIVYDKHPLLEACIDIMEIRDASFQVSLHCEAPAGCSTGTSAAVSTALIGALDLLSGTGRRSPHAIATLAHRVETEKLGLQCGIQDQLCAAYGGICFIEMARYPHATVTNLRLPDPTWWELEHRLVLVYLGHTHSSSNVHKQVIARLEQPGADKAVLDRLRRAAVAGKNALGESDLAAFGRAMVANTEAQAELHPALVSADAQAVIAVAREHGAVGWKVNGAGGEGGSVTILGGPELQRKRAFVRDLAACNPLYRVIPTYLSRGGLRRWESVP